MFLEGNTALQTNIRATGESSQVDGQAAAGLSIAQGNESSLDLVDPSSLSLLSPTSTNTVNPRNFNSVTDLAEADINADFDRAEEIKEVEEEIKRIEEE